MGKFSKKFGSLEDYLLLLLIYAVLCAMETVAWMVRHKVYFPKIPNPEVFLPEVIGAAFVPFAFALILCHLVGKRDRFTAFVIMAVKIEGLFILGRILSSSYRA